MVSRVEIVLILFLLGALALGLSNRTRIVQARQDRHKVHKSAELYDAKNLEVNASGVMNTYSARHAYLIGQTWHMEDFRTRNPDIRLLSARKALRTKRLTRLDGNVTLIRTDGSVYRAQTVIYDRVRKTLNSVGPFDARRGKDYLKGVDFYYEIVPKITRAETVFAHYRLKDAKHLR
ncbi:hypothetical protein [Nitratifractor salsuginis]|uniref:LPS export ABC transporter periplasmic protein LptC n=1 Tax=Nitratifractor salsuginis (strain DSM 16511 / JCM 12458 / E9I37-1) TaxID=749222 RepID=E6X357_NITSE|nr:hypothetical protein [Nitratifractor salsuginis]ADV46201.1 hypothetical protein Nitsa_0942 [Nitratifractor salsuginis DSM 16511]